MDAEKIIEIRKKLGLTQDEFAKKIGSSKNTVYNYENGSKIPQSKITILEKIENELSNIANTDDIEVSFLNAETSSIMFVPLVTQYAYAGYRNTCSFLKEAIKELKFDKLLIVNTKRIHIKSILEKTKEQRSASNKSYNKYLNHFSAVLSELIQWDILQFNPVNKIKELPIGESKANIPATMQQQKKIKEYLLEKDHNFYNFIATLFHTGMRPAEILQIKLSMINLDNRVIKLPFEITKTDIERWVPINNHLYNMLIDMQIEDYPKEFNLFGSFRQPGRGNVGYNKDFIPGPTSIKRDTATRRWEKLIKKELGFPEVTMYSEKHAGANAKILAGIPLDALQELYGHTSKLTTEIYATAVKGQRRQMLIDDSPDF